MAREFISLNFTAGTDGNNNPTGYIADRGTELSIRARFILPPDIDLTQVDNIVTAVGGTPNNEPSVCSDSNTGTPRRLYFYREKGGSMSIPVGKRQDILTAATTIKGILDAGTAGGKVVCIKLKGEEFLNLNDELGVNYTPGVVARSHKTDNNAPRQYYLTGAISYKTDTPLGNGVIQSIKSITDNLDAPATKLSTVWADCVGDLIDVACGNGRSNPRSHRRYILTHLTRRDVASLVETAVQETIELPVASDVATEINTCGTNAAGTAGLVCIGYKGESYDRIHKLI